MSWKAEEFQPIPDCTKSRFSTINIREHYADVESTSRANCKVYLKYVDGEYTGQHQRLDILLLHGASFTSQNWEDLNTLALLGAMGHRAVAVDLPGYGKSSSAKKIRYFIDGLIKKENLVRPIIVSPSMSGGFSLPYVIGTSPSTTAERVRGYVPVAPVATGEYTAERFQACTIPVMSVVGENDTRIGPASTAHLKQFSNCETFVINGAGHACYMNNPDEWHMLLYNFILAMEKI